MIRLYVSYNVHGTAEANMQTREAILDTLRRAAPALAREYGVTRLALFGSFMRGDASPASDVDILVDVDPAIGLRFVDLADHLEALLGARVDLRSRRAIPPRDWPEIEKDLIDVA
jgi:predicted nucleotidyltransferase